MIQGCRYSWRSTDRWTLSKNSTTRQRTQGFGVKPVCIENVSNENTYIQGIYLYPVTAWLRMDLIPNLSLNAIAYPSICPFRSSHVTTQSRKTSATVFLPNGSKLSTADSFAEFFWRNLPSSGRTPHHVGPTGQTPYQILVLTVSNGALLGLWFSCSANTS
jgi:hypothetical protein